VAFLHSARAGIGRYVRRFGPPLLRLAAGVTVLWFLVRQVGAAPFGDGLRAVTWQAVVAAVTLTVLTTVCSAWRWRVVARALGVDIGLPAAVGAYYRSLFLNSVLPGGVLGDVHRAVTHGRRAGDVARGVRAVAWERLWGQVIQGVVTAVVLLTLPSPVRPALPYVLAGIAGAAGCAALVVRGAARRGGSRLARAARAVSADLRHGLLAPGVWPRLTLASVLVVAGHTATFVIAARVAGCTAPLGELVALLMVVQTAVVIPLSIGGWGLREGAAAWAFAAAGLGAANGVTVATLYAVLMLIAVAPGAGLLLGDAIRRRRRGPGHSGDSSGPDPAPRTMEALRGLPAVPGDRPRHAARAVTRFRPAVWLMAAVALFLLAVAGYALLVHASPQYYWTQIDTGVYRDGGIAVRNQPTMLYALELGTARLPFTYTPFAALLFAAGSGASFATWQVGLAVLTIGLLPVVAYLSLGLTGRPAGLARAAAAFAIAAVGLWLEPVAMTLFFGQINLVLLALVVGDLALPDRIKGKGIGIGLAAGIKLTPLIFIPYLLFTRRVKAAAVSALTFAVTVGLGFALLPHASAVYWGGKITRPGSKAFHLDNQSLNGVILRLTHAGPDAHVYWLVAAIVVGIAGLATSILASRRGHELLGLVACAATGLLVSPVTWSHHYVYVVPALVLAAYGPRRLGYRILGAALVVGLFGWWPLPIGNQGGYDPKAHLLPRGLLLLAPNRGNHGAVEFTWRGLELIVGNYYVLTLLMFIAATACALMLTGRLRPERAQPAPEPDALVGR